MSEAEERRVVAIVAAHDEARSIARTVHALSELGAVGEVLVVADGSTDGTADEAAASGARVLAAPRQTGKGRALDAALDTGEGQVYLLVDGDVGESATATQALLDEVLSGRLDLAIGRLPPLAGGGLGSVRSMAAWMIRALTGFEAEAPLSGQRAVTREALEACRPLADGFGVEVGMTIDALRLGFRVGEVPVAMTHRPTGRRLSGFIHRGRQGLDILRAVVPRALRIR
jgi:hypothetical protein